MRGQTKGKTCINTFVNADYIARGLSGTNTASVAFEAGRIMLKPLLQLSDAGVDFSFESTLSSRTLAAFLKTLKRQGYAVAIYDFSLPIALLAGSYVPKISWPVSAENALLLCAENGVASICRMVSRTTVASALGLASSTKYNIR